MLEPGQPCHRARLAAGIIIAAVLLLGTACSAPRLAYERLDWLASWQLSKYTKLDAGQQRRFDTDFKALWVWHRQTELLRYASDLRELAQASQRPVNTALLTAWAQRGDAHWQRLLIKLAPAACAQLTALSEAQVSSLLRRVDRDIAARADELVKPDEAVVRKQAERRLHKSLKRWLGDLNDEQRGRVARWSAERELTYAAWLDQRRLWRSHWAEVLARRHSSAFCTQAQALFAHSAQSSGGGALFTRYDGNRAGWLMFLVQISATLNSAQRQHLRQELLDLAEDFESLAAKAAI